MTSTQGRLVLGALLAAAGLAVPARAGIVITLVPRDANGTAITAGVPGGTEVLVDVLLAADAQDAPLADLRRLRFDFSDTSEGLALGTFTWTFDSLDDAGLYLTNEAEWDAGFTGLASAEGQIVSLDVTPIRVATIAVTVNSTGTLSAIGPASGDQSAGALFSAGFEAPVTFSVSENNVSGGTITLTASSTAPEETVNVAPTATDGSMTVIVDASATAVTLSGTDPNAGDLVENYRIDSLPSTGTLSLNGVAVKAGDTVTGVLIGAGSLTYQPEAGFSGSTSFTFSASDGEEWSAAPATFTISVIPPLDAANTNRGPRAVGSLCGMGMVGTSLLILCGLTGLGRQRRGRHG